MNDLWQRLKQRKLVQWAVAYMAGAWALLQVLDLAANSYHLPDIVMHLTFGVVALGLVITMLLAWYHGERGQQRVSGVELLILAGVFAIGGFLIWHYSGTDAAPATTAVQGGTTSGSDKAIVAPGKVPAKSIAVLPLANDSGDKDQQYFSDGLSEDLITALSQFAGLKVISRNSSFEFRDSKDDSKTIGAKLGVAHLLEGSVRRAGDTVRISAALVKAADGSMLWSQRYDRPYKDLFKLQDEITTAVAEALEAKLLSADGAVLQSDRPPSGNLRAYGEYTQGSFYRARESEADVRQAIDHYQRAIRLDPGYAMAYAALADSWAFLATGLLGGNERRDGYAWARAASARALALNPNIAAAHDARGYLLTYADFDWIGAQAAYRRALQLAPNEGTAQGRLAFLLAALGRPAEAVPLVQRALAIDPLSAGGHLQLSRYLSATGHLDDAEVAIRRAIDLQPGAESYPEQLAIIEILRGDSGAALRAAQQGTPGIWQRAALALALQIGPDRKAADAALQALIDQDAATTAYQIAQVYALRRQPDKAFEWLDRAWDDRDPGISLLLFDPFLLRYKADPRFAAFCRKVGLPVQAADPVASRSSRTGS